MRYIKIGAYIIGIIFIAGIAYKWLGPAPKIITTNLERDTSFVNVEETTYTPPSTPFENPGDPPAELPDNIEEEDVKEVIVISKINPTDITKVILTKDGKAHVSKESGRVKSVLVTEYLPPILNWGWFKKAGIDGNDKRISPFIGIAFLEIKGKVQLPVFSLDLQGIGIGADYTLVKHCSIGLMYHDAWNTEKSIRLKLAYEF